MFASLGRLVYRRRLPVALAWVVVLAVGLGFGSEVFARLGTGSGLRDDAESVVVADLLGRLGGSATELTGVVDGRDAADPAFRAEISRAAADLEAVPGVRRVVAPWQPRTEGPPGAGAEGADRPEGSGEPQGGAPEGRLVARDGRAVQLRVEVEQGLDERVHASAVRRIEERLRAIDAPRVLVG
ncbi:MAG TPA: hypothetical protein VFU54_09555, partial [Actinomycetota bacterium]|nr:hypothetical protein [Actinomycetota bacterium]